EGNSAANSDDLFEPLYAFADLRQKESCQGAHPHRKYVVRIQFKGLVQSLSSEVISARHMYRITSRRRDVGSERLELHSPRGENDRLFFIEHHAEICVPEVSDSISGIQLDCPGIRGASASPVPVEEVFYHSSS